MRGAEKEEGKCSQLEDGKVECCQRHYLSRFPKVRSEFQLLRMGPERPVSAAKVARLASHNDGWVDMDAPYVTSSNLCCGYSSSNIGSSTVCTTDVHSSTPHEPTNAFIDLSCARSYTLATQPIRDSLYSWQKISPRSEGSSNRAAS